MRGGLFSAQRKEVMTLTTQIDQRIEKTTKYVRIVWQGAHGIGRSRPQLHRRPKRKKRRGPLVEGLSRKELWMKNLIEEREQMGRAGGLARGKLEKPEGKGN